MNSACMTTASQALALGLCAYPAAGHTDREKPKRPFGKWEMYQTQRPTPHQLAALYTRHKFTTAGLICGAISGWLEVLDFDTVAGYQQFHDAVKSSDLASVFDRIGQGYAERTPRGMHLLYYCDAVEGNKKLNEKLKIETRGEGGYVVIAPSNLSEGDEVKQYRLTSGGLDSIARISPEERRALHALISSLACECKAPEMVNIEPAPGTVIREGGRNGALTSLAGSMRKRGMSDEALTAALHAENKARCAPPLPDDEVQTIVRSIIKYPAGQYQQVSALTTWQTPQELPSGIPAVPRFDPEQLLPPTLGGSGSKIPRTACSALLTILLLV